MIVLIRADATTESGTGHIMRCAALALRLQSRGAQVHFACNSLPPALLAWLEARAINVHLRESIAADDRQDDLRHSAAIAVGLGGVDLLVVDHYALGLAWERGMRPHARRILVIDDLADRHHDCDVLLNQNLRDDADSRYAQYLPAGVRRFVGPRFALLREEFDDPGLLRTREGPLHRLFVFFGGSDPGNQSLKVVEALNLLGPAAPSATMVLGSAHPASAEVFELARGRVNLTVLGSSDKISNLMAQADLAIGTCGIAAWERCALGLPSLVVVTAENQREDAQILHRLGAVQNLGNADTIAASHFARALEGFLDAPSRLAAMSAAASAVMGNRHSAAAEFEEALFV